MDSEIFIGCVPSLENSQAQQARLRNQLREIEEPFLEKFMRWMSQFEIMALWGNWISLNDEASLSEIFI